MVEAASVTDNLQLLQAEVCYSATIASAATILATSSIRLRLHYCC